ncbi:MAG: hypothetical protein M0030_17180 [Actinomycetota bacterium]|nr:hypothetical protein [Actinomycetota bacterium]
MRSLSRVLGVGEDDAVAVIGAPDGFADRLTAELLGEAVVHTHLDEAERYDVIVAFVTRQAELAGLLGRLIAQMAPTCGLWVVWPVGTAAVATDLTPDRIQHLAGQSGLAMPARPVGGPGQPRSIHHGWQGIRLTPAPAAR